MTEQRWRREAMDVGTVPDTYFSDTWARAEAEDVRALRAVSHFMDMTFNAAVTAMRTNDLYSDERISTARWLARLQAKHL